LPADIANFTGRKKEIDFICKSLLGRKPLSIVSVAGMAGVGKSSLAIHVAHQLAKSDFPDVQLYEDLRGSDGDPLEAGDVLSKWLRAFGLDESLIPLDLQERASVYRSQMAGKRAIVVLDNAKDESQIKPLLPGSQTCAVILTSRRILSVLQGAIFLDLKVLSNLEAWELLANLVGVLRLEAEQEEATEILRFCAGLPLAIRIVGGTLKSKPHWRLVDYRTKLADERQRLAHLQLKDLAVRASFELSYRELSATDGLLFSRLGMLIGKNFKEDLAEVLEKSENPVIDRIERLIDAQLLEPIGDHRYRFHDLLHLFAREKLAAHISVEEQEVMKQQIVDWGHKQSDLMNVCLYPMKRHQMVQKWIESGKVIANFGEQHSNLSALAWFEYEKSQLITAINWAKNAERWDIVLSLVENLVNFLESRSYVHDWEEISLIALQVSRQSGDRHRQSQSLNNLGNVFRLQSRWDIAIDFYQESLNICRELNDMDGEAKSLMGLAIIYQSQNRWDEAIDFYQENLVICQKSNDWYAENTSLDKLGDLYQSQNRWGNAMDCYQRSLTIYRELNDLYGQVKSLVKLAIAYQSQNLWDEVIDCYEQSLPIYRELSDGYSEAQALGNLGKIYERKGEPNRAIAFWKESLAKLPEGATEYQETKESLKNAQKIKLRAFQKSILPFILVGIVTILLLVNPISGRWIVAVVILGLAIGFWLLLRLWRMRSR
jgi:tetratricopeptide (TPR) repeat protein